MKKLKEKTKKKEIYYYRPLLQKYDRDTNRFKNIDETSQEFLEIFTQIEEMSLEKDNPNSVYLKRDLHSYNYISVQFKNKDYIYGELITSSNDVYPSIDQDGNIIPLIEKLPPNSNLAHITHFVFFLDENIVGIEYNNVGARPTSLATYINNKFLDKYRVELVEAVNSTALNKLEKTKRIKDLEIKLDTRSIVAEESEEGELFAALNAANEIAKDSFSDDQLTISIRIKSRYGFKITNTIKDSLKKLGLNRKVSDETNIKGERIKIKSQSEENENFDFDLVRQVIKAPRVSVRVNENNMIDSDDMFEKIIENYKKYK